MKYSLLTIAFFLCTSLFSQYDVEDVKKDSVPKDTKFDVYQMKQHTYVGGDISLRFGTNTYIYLAPLIGYDIYKNFSGGVTTIYQLVRWNNGAYSYNESTIGVGGFLRYRPIQPIILQTEFDIFNTVNYSGTPEPRINVPAFFMGLGYAGNMGSRSYYNILLLYDFIRNPNMPVPPFIQQPFYLRAGMVWYLG